MTDSTTEPAVEAAGGVTIDLRFEEAVRSLEDLESSVDALADRVHLNDERIDVIQAQRDDPTPWWRRASTWSVVVAVAAIAFSGWTTVLSSQRLAAEDVQNDRAEVRELLQRLSTIEAEAVVAFSQLDSRTAELLSNTVGVEQLLIARQALEVMQRIPDHVTANEYWLVGNTLMLLDKYGDAEVALVLAEEKAQETGDDADKILALQARAQNAFLQQRFAEGREHFAAALAIYVDTPPISAYLVPFSAAQTELMWAASEHATGNCDEIGDHLDAAQRHIDLVLEVLKPGLQATTDEIAATPCVVDGNAS